MCSVNVKWNLFPFLSCNGMLGSYKSSSFLAVLGCNFSRYVRNPIILCLWTGRDDLSIYIICKCWGFFFNQCCYFGMNGLNEAFVYHLFIKLVKKCWTTYFNLELSYLIFQVTPGVIALSRSVFWSKRNNLSISWKTYFHCFLFSFLSNSFNGTK